MSPSPLVNPYEVGNSSMPIASLVKSASSPAFASRAIVGSALIELPRLQLTASVRWRARSLLHPYSASRALDRMFRSTNNRIVTCLDPRSRASGPVLASSQIVLPGRCRSVQTKRSVRCKFPTFSLFVAAYFATCTTGGFQVPSRIALSGQYARSQIEKFPGGAGSQLDSFSLPGDLFPR